MTADGEARLVDAESEPDLFWALRGGGGNFGVAASFEFETHPLDIVLGGLLAHPLAAAGDVIDMFRQFTKDLPDEATVFCGLVHAPDGSGTKLCALPLCHSGELGQAEADLAPLRQFGPPLLDLVEPMPYPVVNTMLDDGFPKGALNYWKSAFFTELSDAAVQTMVEAFEAAPSIMTGMVIEHFHGEVCRVDPDRDRVPVPRARLQPRAGRTVERPCGHRGQRGVGPRHVHRPRAVHRAEGLRELPRRRRGRQGRRRVRPEPRPARRDQAPLRSRQPLPAQPQHRSRLTVGPRPLHGIVTGSP